MAMRTELTFEFDNLPIITDLGFDAAPVDGAATIRFNTDGEWYVTDITVTGSRMATQEEIARTGTFVRKQVDVCPQAHKWLYDAIRSQLEDGPFNATITDKVVEALDEVGISARVLA